MGKKKRGHPDVEEILGRPWCYYCERDFDDQKVLINHQKAKHFKCERCGRRLNTAGGLSVHMSQVHKETLSAVDNALPNRAGLDIEIFGMEGIPEDIVQQHNHRVLTQFHQLEAERRAASGGAGGGASGAAAGAGAKKPKFESPADIKKRLAEHKAKMAAEQNGTNSGGGTPIGVSSPAAPGTSVSYPPQQQFNGAPGNGNFNFSPVYAQPPRGQQFPQQGGQPGQHFQQPNAFPPQPALSQPAFTQPQPAFSPPPYQQQSPYGNPQIAPPVMQASPQPFAGPPHAGSMQLPPHSLPMQVPPRTFGAPPQPFGYPHQQPRINTPPQNGMPPQRTMSGGLPPAPGLPQRPAFGAPHVNHFQMQQMHQGQIPGPPNPPMPNISPSNGASQLHGQQISPSSANQPTSLDDLISGAVKQAEETARTAGSTPKPVETATDDKKEKKDKSKATQLVYSDQQTSPEEKMARLPRYAFTPVKAQ